MARMEGEGSKNEAAVVKSMEKKDEGDVLLCSNLNLPISH